MASCCTENDVDVIFDEGMGHLYRPAGAWESLFISRSQRFRTGLPLVRPWRGYCIARSAA